MRMQKSRVQVLLLLLLFSTEIKWFKGGHVLLIRIVGIVVLMLIGVAHLKGLLNGGRRGSQLAGGKRWMSSWTKVLLITIAKKWSKSFMRIVCSWRWQKVDVRRRGHSRLSRHCNQSGNQRLQRRKMIRMMRSDIFRVCSICRRNSQRRQRRGCRTVGQSWHSRVGWSCCRSSSSLCLGLCRLATAHQRLLLLANVLQQVIAKVLLALSLKGTVVAL